MSSTTPVNTMPVNLRKLFSSAPGPCTPATPTVTFPETPKSSRSSKQKYSRREHRHEKTNSPSHKNCFAGGSFINSPSARAVPMPPSEWIIDEVSMDRACDGTESDSNYSSADSMLSRQTPEFCKGTSVSPVSPASPGIRVTPLELIAAVVSA